MLLLLALLIVLFWAFGFFAMSLGSLVHVLLVVALVVVLLHVLQGRAVD